MWMKKIISPIGTNACHWKIVFIKIREIPVIRNFAGFIFLLIALISQNITVLPPDNPHITSRFTPRLPPDYPSSMLDLPYILKSRFDCAFFFFDSHINLNHLLILNFLSNLYTSEKKFVCGYFQLLFVCELSEMASSKKLQKNFFWSGFFFIKNWNFWDFLILGQIKWNLCRSYK